MTTHTQSPVIDDGKYRGKTYAEILAVDPGKVVSWLLSAERAAKSNPRFVKPEHLLTTGQRWLLDHKEMIWEKYREANPVDPGEWIGDIGDRIHIEVTVNSIRHGSNRYGSYRIVTMSDSEGNLVYYMGASKAFGRLFTGARLLLTATVSKLDEYRGIRETHIARIRVEKIYDRGAGLGPAGSE